MTTSAVSTLIRVPIDSNDVAVRLWLSRGLLCPLAAGDDHVFSSSQLDQLRALSLDATVNSGFVPPTTGLFPADNELRLGQTTVIGDGLSEDMSDSNADGMLLQLLPYWISAADSNHREFDNRTWSHAAIGSLDISCASATLAERIKDAQRRVRTFADSRVAQFARSASYMGSKAGLAPYFAEVLRTLLPSGTAMLDLMCGSGAASWVFSRTWRTFASDAQQFSPLLGVVQGGGMDAGRAHAIAGRVLSVARDHFATLPSTVLDQIEIERQFLASELTDEVLTRLVSWIVSYPRIGNPRATLSPEFLGLIGERQDKGDRRPFLLFSAYYGNLFYGVRQAAEIDSLRYAVEKLEDPLERQWALGALVCAASSCAYVYGGHFAQPKVDGSESSKVVESAPTLLVSRGLSVSHEFFVRLTSLGAESSSALFPVEPVDGPWERAVEAAATLAGNSPLCVYLDPPYTRDEYSRYYHVLETLVRYDYPSVHGKASMPRRGHAGRFASAFGTRDVEQIEALLVRIIDACLERGWNCLWSYSSSGVASMARVLEKSQASSSRVDVFCMDHSYKAQGKHGAKAVKEFAVLLRTLN